MCVCMSLCVRLYVCMCMCVYVCACNSLMNGVCSCLWWLRKYVSVHVSTVW